MARNAHSPLLALALAIGVGSCTPPQPQTDLRWEQTATSLALYKNDHVVWEFHCQRGEGKPAFHPLATVDGVVLTDFRPADHPWHRAAWFCLHSINGVNYWEEDPVSGLAAGRTRVVDFDFRPAEDFSAELDLDLSYAPAEGAEVLVERRRIRLSAPAEDGSYSMDWQLVFTARTALELQRTPRPGEEGGASWGGYAGISLRLDPKLKGWSFLDSEGRDDGSFGKCAGWLSFHGALEDRAAGLTIFDHPQNLTFPSAWFTELGMPYFSPAFLFYKPIKLIQGEELKLFYRVKIDSTLPEAADLDAEAADFAEQEFELSGPGQIDLVELGEHVFSTNCEACHARDPDSVEFRTGPNLYAAISTTPHWHEVLEDGVPARVLADEDFLRHSLHDPARRLALHSSGPQRGQPFLPLMPTFDNILSDQQVDALVAYLLTLNPEQSRGPMHLWAGVERAVSSLNPHEVVVRDKPLVRRVIVDGYAPRAFAVGHTDHFSYLFDPEDCSVRHAWRGGFLDLSGERMGRGTGPNRPAREQSIGFRPFLTPLDEETGTGGRVHFEAYSMQPGRAPQIHYSMGGGLVRQRLVYSGAGTLQFQFECEGVTAPLRFRFDQEKILGFTCPSASVSEGVLLIPTQAATDFTLDVRLAAVPPSVGASNLAAQAIGFSNGRDDGSSIGPWGAIDGNPMSWWDETDQQDEYSLRLILDQRRAFNQLRISGYQHHDFAPKSFQVFVDGNLAAEIVDAEYRDNLLLVDLPETLGQALELRIHDYYGGSPAIRELEIYHQSTAAGQDDTLEANGEGHE